jgi:hypothetical protein
VHVQDSRNEIIKPGIYRCLVIKTAPGKNPSKPSFLVELQILDAMEGSEQRIGDRVSIVYSINTFSAPEIRALVMHALGFGPSLSQWQDDPIAARRIRTEAEEEVDLYQAKCGGNADITGRAVDVIVTAGKPRVDQDGNPTGDFFRNFTWGSVPETEPAA